jgi:hypothetical protein
MSCCSPREKPDSNIPFTQMGCPCDTWAHLKDMFVYLKDERAGVVPCVPSQFTVQWSTIDPMTYMYSVTDTLTNDLVQYSVTKEYLRETPLEAFERDWRTREVFYNRGTVSAIGDLLETMEDTYPLVRFKLERQQPERYIIHKPIAPDLGVIVFKVEYDVALVPKHADRDFWKTIYPDEPIDLPVDLLPEIAYNTNLLVKRFRKIGVRFSHVVNEKIKDFNRFTIFGASYRDHESVNIIRISYQDLDLTDPELNLYHEYYTTKGKQNGFYHCR